MTPEMKRLQIMKKMIEEAISLQVLIEKDSSHKKEYTKDQRVELKMVGYMVEYGFNIPYPDQNLDEVSELEAHIVSMKDNSVNADKHLFEIEL